jgi:hypothetical protein
MYRNLVQAMLACWIAAVLTVSPLLAALECRQCCGPMSAASADDHVCTHEAKSETPVCCQGESKAPAQEPGRCDHCPKCELKRPLTAMVSGSFDWKLPTDFVTAILPPPADTVALLTQALESARAETIDLGTPPPRILFCCWRE